MSDTCTIRVVRLYADDFEESGFEIVTIPMLQREFAPPAAPLHVTDAQPAQHYVVIELPVGWGRTEPHPTPGRHMMFCLAGQFRVTAGSGETRSFAAGDCLLMEDRSGRGRITGGHTS
jgi:quercetin dioxygenase-like cupin family protein